MSGTEKSLPQDRDQRICENIGLVHACARRFLGRGVEYDDLFQAGCMGLVKAADGFEEERGLRFSTYAVPVILGEIRRAVPRRGIGEGEPFPQGAVAARFPGKGCLCRVSGPGTHGA